MATLTTRAIVALPWLLRVRWVIIAGQAAVVAIATLVLRIALPLPVLASLIGLAAVTNAVAHALPQRWPASQIAGILLMFDVIQLTGLLSVTGGPLNPFSMMFLVYITLAAVVLGARWTWAIATAAAAGFGALFITPVDQHSPLAHAFSGQMGGHLQGMWWAFAIAASLTAAFVVRLSREIDDRDRELAAAQDRASRIERLASITTLAAGAAHELGTPLSTIAVAAGELERSLQTAGATDALEDVRLIQQQLDRARGILSRLARRAGDPPGEMPQRLSLIDIVEHAMTLIPPAQRSRVDVEVPAAWPIGAPLVSLAEAVAGLVRNGLDAGADRVRVSASRAGRWVTLSVRDTGPGMSAEVLDRVGEPFFTTKPPGEGLGLGVFLARQLASDLGGSLNLASTKGTGTTATLRLPAAAEAEGADT